MNRILVTVAACVQGKRQRAFDSTIGLEADEHGLLRSNRAAAEVPTLIMAFVPPPQKTEKLDS